MAIASGTKLGPYEIESHLDSGGMGVVYKALDTRLERYVALKILTDELARDRAVLTDILDFAARVVVTPAQAPHRP